MWDRPLSLVIVRIQYMTRDHRGIHSLNRTMSWPLESHTVKRKLFNSNDLTASLQCPPVLYVLMHYSAIQTCHAIDLHVVARIKVKHYMLHPCY